MSQLIEYTATSGLNLYAVVRWNGQLWNTNLLVFENFNSSHWATDYVISLNEQSPTGYYSASYPSQILSLGILTSETIYQQASPNGPTTRDYALQAYQSQGTNVVQIAGNGTSALNLSISAGLQVLGQVTPGTITTTQITTNLTGLNNGQYSGRVILFYNGNDIYAAAAISGFLPSNGLLTFTPPLPVVPSLYDKFIII